MKIKLFNYLGRAFFAFSLFIIAPFSYAVPGPFAVWAYADMAGSATIRNDFFNFAAQRNINHVYLASGTLLRTNQTGLADFIVQAKSRSIAVTLLLGEYEWALTPNHARAIELTRKARLFAEQLAAQGAPMPAGIQFDVEPYALPEWDGDMQGTANQFLDMLAKLRTEVGGILPVSVTIPFWYDSRAVTRNQTTRPLSEWTIDATDATVMMDYRNTASRIINGANTEMAYASTTGKPLTVGVNVKCASGADYAVTTFCDAGQQAMLDAVETSRMALSPYQSYTGFAVFSYENWVVLNP